MLEGTFLGIDGHAAVVAHMLVTSGSHVEEGCLSAIRISDQSHLDDLAALLRHRSHFTLHPFLLRLKRRQGLECRAHEFCLALADHLDLVRLITSEGNLIAYDLILDGITKRGIKDDLHLIALHKTHFYYPLTEAAVTVYLYDHATFSRLQFR